MQITRQADYAVRAMVYLAQLGKNVNNGGPKRAATSRIAQEKSIPPSFLAKIVSQLSVAGLLSTTRGAHGGVSLAKEPHEISLLDVVEAIDGPILLNECVSGASDCQFGDTCELKPVWCDAQRELVMRLRQTHFGLFVHPGN